MPDYLTLYFEYELEFGSKRAQSLLFVSEDLSLEDVIKDEMAAEYLRNPAKTHLAKYLRGQLEEDLGL
nr:hypothetical protein [Pseudomonas sp. s4]